VGDRFPFGIPQGWYAVATSAELPVGGLLSRRYFEKELVLFRTEERLSIVDAFCPHMGAHLGRVGKVDGNLLRCGFHGFRYNGAGTCVSTEYDGPPPGRARLSHWEVREHSGFIFTWFDPEGAPPQWEMKVPDTRGVSAPRVKQYEIDTHPQETTENSVDFGHFTKLHGFESGQILAPLETDGPYLTSTYLALRPYRIPGREPWMMRVEYDVRVSGLGYSQVEVEVDLELIKLGVRIFVLPVPIDDEHIHLRLGASMKGNWGPLTPMLRAIVHRIVCHEVDQDLDVWQHKKFLDPPQLAKGDGPIIPYRRWASQFYPSS
jgi:nitrite reductase/ring-hydroxylating ferredoxin subunit